MSGDAKAAPSPRISVLVCTRNRAQSIRQCIESILQSDVAEMELLVVDQSDGTVTRDALAGLDDPRLRYPSTPTRGLARARNVGIEASAGSIVLFTDDDCYVEVDWVRRFLDEFDRDPTLDAVYGRVVPYGEGGPGQTCPTIMKSTEPRLVEGLNDERVQQAVGHGNSMAFQRRCFERHGLFLEWLGAGTPMKGGEDTDFSFRLLRDGARIYYSPKPLAYHDNWMPIADSQRQLYGYVRSGGVVYTRFVLRGSAVAWKIQRLMFANYAKDMAWWRTQKNNADGIRHVHKMRRRHVAGILWGFVYAFHRAPRYRPGQRTHEWHESRLADPAGAVR